MSPRTHPNDEPAGAVGSGTIPGCDICGALLVDPEKHADWHRSQGYDPDTGLCLWSQARGFECRLPHKHPGKCRPAADKTEPKGDPSYTALCMVCEPRLPMPFSDAGTRAEWISAHLFATGHSVQSWGTEPGL